MRWLRISCLLWTVFCLGLSAQTRSIIQNRHYQDAFQSNPNWFVADFELKRDLHLTLDQDVFNTGGFTYVQIPMLFKTKVSQHISVLTGVKMDFLRTDDWDPNMPIYGVIGVPYDLPNDFFVQATFNYQLNNAAFNSRNFKNLKSLINLSGGFKF